MIVGQNRKTHHHKTVRRTLVLGLLVIVMAVMTACGTPANAQDDGRINAVATIGMLADVVRNVGGDRVAVTQLMGAGIDPHLYRATEGDVITLTEAEIIFYSGLHLEARMAEVLELLGDRLPTVAVGEAVPVEQRLASTQYPDQPDPHIWMDVDLWTLAAGRVRDALVELDPEGAAVYEANYEAYAAQLEELDEYVQQQINTIPQQQRVLVTAHDAFNYYGRAYGIEVFAPQGISTQSEAGVADIRSVISVLVARNVPAIFVESSVPRDVVEAIVEGSDARGHEVTIGGSLFSDAMGELGTPEGTYIGMIRHNTDTIVGALTGNAEE